MSILNQIADSQFLKIPNIFGRNEADIKRSRPFPVGENGWLDLTLGSDDS